MADYIVVSAENAELTKIALGMLGAGYLEQQYQVPYAYPMQGPTHYIWNAALSLDGTQAAFGPLDTGIDPEFGTWCLGRELEVTDDELVVSITIPSTAQTLAPSWFAPL